MSKVSNAPCHNCICVPICRNKSFHRLCIDCSLVHNYLYDIPTKSDRVLSHYRQILITLNPCAWTLDSIHMNVRM